VVAVTFPAVPVMVTVLVPSDAELLADNVSMLNPVVGFGANDAVTPLGRPDRERFTLPVNPYCGFTKMLVVAEVPWPIFTTPGLVSVKPCA
jgi:hypothetical protein